MGYPSVQWSNLAILIACQLISATGSIVIITLAGIIGAGLTDTPAWATLPVSMTVVALALSTIPATILMRKIGRARGFAMASMSAVGAVCVAAFGIHVESFGLFVLSGILFGINMAFTQQYRYAAAESVPADKTPLAISFVLVGSIGGALLGPELATRGRDWIGGVPYGGTLLSLAALYTVQALLLLRLEARDESSGHADRGRGRALREILTQPTYIVAVLGCTAGYGLMTLIMTATPLSMHVFGGHSLEATAGVIRAHVLGMYVPSLFSGFLIARLGVSRLMLVGALALLATSVIGLQGQTVLHYWWALSLLGVGWNFLYVGGTTMLTYTYTPGERFRAQAVNEFLVFGTSATASLLAGTVMHLVGWTWLMLIPIPVLLAVGVALVFVRHDDGLLRRLSDA
jgi:MFS family permease